jgi:hypothetical protein
VTSVDEFNREDGKDLGRRTTGDSCWCADSRLMVDGD